MQKLFCGSLIFLFCNAVNANVPVPIAWTDYYSPTQSNPNGGNVETLSTNGTISTIWTGSTRVDGIAYNPLQKKVYWTDVDNGSIYNANLNGTGFTTALTWVPPPGEGVDLSALALDPAKSQMYWVDSTDFGHSPAIRRASLDGSNPTTLIQPSIEVVSMALDLANGKMYWTNYVADQVWSANLDGSDPTLLMSNIYASGIAVDTATNKLYLSGRTPLGNTGPYSYFIKTANLDGSGLTNLFTSGLNDPRGMALDPALGIGYEADLGSGRILQFNLNGSSSPFSVVSGLSDPIDVTLVPEPASMGLLFFSAIGMALRRRANRCPRAS